ncbi:ESF1 homolog [Halyomorpha halys]|uniref:ESF1 homolog n=1 Tax=Halyomorpha halys TaxID=286706 RepID=UPI0006D4FE9D|nr:ESF1 homolog [Halyomorpha halys]
MDNVLKDKRFKNALSDPRFRNVPWKDRKVKIDKRFESMFTDKRFQIKYAVDERGRPIDQHQSENYKKYYDLSDSSDESGSESPVEEEEESAEVSDSEKEQDIIKDEIKDEDNSLENTEQSVVGEHSDIISKDSSDSKDKLKVAQKEVNKYIDEIHKKKLDGKIRDKLTDFTVDYARGVGTLISDSSSDESSSDESDVVNIVHPWGELDKDAEETNEITPRLAVCNMDWDRVTANDLMVLFHSFLPPDGVIESITIYPSEFGLARMTEEEQKGPKELVELKNDHPTEDTEPEVEIEEGSAYQREKLREYQLKRLKYYYAVIVCNSKETANVLYTECDGLEYESSAMKLDLRFIDDDVTFDEKPHDTCTALPDLKKYKPRLFVNTALQQGKVDLTWDETDPNRIEFSKKLLAGEEVDEDDLQNFVAYSSSSNEEEKEEEVLEEKNQNEVEDVKDSSKNDKDRIKKYRDLVANLQEGKSKKRGDVEMEVTWGATSNKSKKDQSESENENENSGSSDESSGFVTPEKTNIRKKGKKIKKKSIQSDPVSAVEQQRNAELELLLADDNPVESGLKHFSLKEIQKQEKHQEKKRNPKNKLNYQEEDSFKINPSDDRFSAVYTSHQFNIDPADPHYRKTKGMEQLIGEKLKRRKLEG